MRFKEAVDQALAESAVTFSEHNNQTRERFLAILGHDLRTPLAAVSMTGSLLERSKSSEDNAAIGKRLLGSAATMSTMVNDLLEYALVQLPAEGEQPARPRTSLGLGLFIARETALAHGGSIHVSSSVAGGTTFTVRIPRAVAPPKGQGETRQIRRVEGGE